MVYAINCQEQDTTIHCGALYLEPLVPFKIIRLSHKSASVKVELPAEFVNQTESLRAWSIDLPIADVSV